ncbi:undecaprenyl-diphosphate phosphatase [Phaeobacter sp.]|uniref:undecaprenyl-diphosphate phosphatase n=1 Tax=Phaeobacter sp. TaxID=1902409 RepID=UPI0025F74AE0|nr:undecaprenyl-diphosphate phosphatase [Phaeobacter sp.]
MPLFQLILIALIQGVTEFLPVSSSGHLILLPGLTQMEDQGQVIDVAVHVGTLFAVVLFFWSDVKIGLLGLPRALTGRLDSDGARLAMGLIVATIPTVILGAILHFTGLSDALRSITVIGWTMLGFGLVLYVADRFAPERKSAGSWGLKDAFIMGLWQMLALIPGTSRSGITITGARHLGYTRLDAARLSMLMSIPTILASAVLLGADTTFADQPGLLADAAIAAVLSMLAALAALAIMMRLLRTISFAPYVIYRVVLGIILLVVAYQG